MKALFVAAGRKMLTYKQVQFTEHPYAEIHSEYI